MATNNPTEADVFTCSICYDIFEEPKILSCLHRFCEKCLQSYITGQKSSILMRQGGFQCPVCREMIKIPNPKRPLLEWAGFLKTDFHFNEIIQVMRTKSGVISTAKKLKQPCKKHKDIESDLFCVDCQQIICHLCAGISHRSCNQVVTLSEAAADKRKASKAWIDRLGKILSHSVSIDQLREKHINNLERQKARAEEQIKAWSEDWQLRIRKEEVNLLQNLNKQYQSMSDKMAIRLFRFDEKIGKAKQNMQAISLNGNSMSDSDMLKLSDIIQSDVIKELEHSISMYKSFVDYIQRIEIVYDRSPIPAVDLGSLVLRTYNEPTDTPFISSKTLEVSTEKNSTRVYDLDIPSSVLYSKEVSSEPVVSVKGLESSTVNDSVKSRLMSTLSRVLPKKPSITPRPRTVYSRENSVSESSEGRPAGRNKTETQADCEGSQTSEIVTNVKELRSINANFREDQTASKLRDVLVTTPGNTILVTDWANQCVKAFFVRRDKDCRLTVGGKPWAITQLGSSLAAVSLPLAMQICVLKITSPLMVQKSFMVAKNYSGLATLNGQTLVASGGSDPPSVDIINLFGEVLRSFSRDEQGNSLFIYPAYVNVTPSAEILVSDKKRGAVICLSHTGKVQFEFSPQGSKQLLEPNGITSLRSGHVLLLELRGLLKLTPKGQFDRPLIHHQDGHVINPRGIDVDTDGLVYITTNEEEVKVFEVT